jgi:uncharacterized membrane protein YagU involved in acid resistance
MREMDVASGETLRQFADGDARATDTRNNGRSALRAILWGTLIAGTLDITSAIVIWGIRGAPPTRILQSVATGLLGRDSYSGGLPTAVLGLLLHFLIMSVIVTIYVTASGRLAALKKHPVLCGAAYGVVVYFFMSYVVLPLSAAGGKLPSAQAVMEGLMVHIPLVGIAIGLITRRFARAVSF